MPELLATLSASRRVKFRDYKFHAAMQGVELPDEDSEKAPTFEELQRQATIRAQGGDPDLNDILSLTGSYANSEGMGLNIEGGLSYSRE